MPWPHGGPHLSAPLTHPRGPETLEVGRHLLRGFLESPRRVRGSSLPQAPFPTLSGETERRQWGEGTSLTCSWALRS